MNEFYCATRILAGEAGQVLSSLKPKRLLVVTDPYFMENGTARRLAEASGAESWELFSEVEPDPPVELAAKGTAQLKAFVPDTVAALGGGSAMDCAKAMVYFSGLQPRLIAIPTTSGSGSEVTDFAVLTHGKGKHPLVDDSLQPYAAVLDENLLTQLPKTLIADAGFDVLAHALEAYVAAGASEMTDALAKEAFCIAFAHLPASYGGAAAVRGRIHMAATMAGVAFSNAGLGLCHAMSHALGGMFHVPHGRLNAVLLPTVVGCNALVVGDKYARIARSAGLCGAADTVAVRNLKNGLCRLRRELSLPETLRQAGVDPRKLRGHGEALVKAVLEDPCCTTNPLTVEDFMVRKVLEEVAGRG